MKVWIAGKELDWETSAWEFAGVFDTEQKAVGACHTKDYFVAEVGMNIISPHDSCEFAVCYYPHVETKEEGAMRLSKITLDI